MPACFELIFLWNSNVGTVNIIEDTSYCFLYARTRSHICKCKTFNTSTFGSLRPVEDVMVSVLLRKLQHL